ncbi:MAG: hypothetical protein SGJ20_19480 [Planctomycetota bacterium]|nr:hypothetical protein [Planctomycetota bacterium]
MKEGAAKTASDRCVASFRRGPRQIQFQQLGQDLLVCEIGRPAVGGADGFVEFAMGQVEPGGTLVLEIRQRPLLEFLGAIFVLGNQARVADRADCGCVGTVDIARPRCRGRLGLLQHFAQIEKMLLAGAAFRKLDTAPLGDEIVRRHAVPRRCSGWRLWVVKSRKRQDSWLHAALPGTDWGECRKQTALDQVAAIAAELKE